MSPALETAASGVESRPHVPVLLDEVIAALAIERDEVHVDGTFGAGGYTRAMLGRGAQVFAFDRDPDAIREGQSLMDESGTRLTLVPERFSRMRQALLRLGVEAVDGVTLDIGVSSMQLDQPERGFSFQADGPLDMRMERAGQSAADFVNNADEAEIADILYHYGEEPKSRRIARAIVAARPIERTRQLAEIVRKAVGHKPGAKKDPATRTFQAIRIHLNEELQELEGGLSAAEDVLKPGGRLAVVTFHSLEDRVVKRFLRERSGAVPAGSRHRPAQTEALPAPTFEAVGKPVRAGEAEIRANPRARSATLRVAHRTAASAWSPPQHGEPAQGQPKQGKHS
ncbi:MAG: rsmH [Alphaproteobacteria bacterium]|nr:rsmH [Alphaproteobacteria bacterium]